MPTIRIPIVENRHKSQAKLFDKLPDAAKQLFVAIAKSGRSFDPQRGERIMRVEVHLIQEHVSGPTEVRLP